MPTEELALLAAVIADPDDDTLRLAYADWLDENAGSLPKARRATARQQAELIRLQVEEAIWLNRRDRVHLREVTDRVLRYVESLDVIRDRATILHEDMTAQIAERISRTSNRLTAIAAIFLPPSLVAGIFGMNLAGIPAHEHELSFGIVTAIMVGLMVLEAWILRRLGWI